MAEKSVTLQPGESKVISFEAIPHEAKTYQVLVNGLTGSFRAKALTLVDGYGLGITSFGGKNFVEVGVDPDGIPYGVLSEPAMVVSTYVTNTMPWTFHWRLAPSPTQYPFSYFVEGRLEFIGNPNCLPGCVLSYSRGVTGEFSGGPGTVWEGNVTCIGPYHDTCSIKGTYSGTWDWQLRRNVDGHDYRGAGSFRIKNMLALI